MKKSRNPKRPKKKLRFVQSLLNPSGVASPPLLIKQRVPIQNQFSMPSFVKKDLTWLDLFKSTSSDFVPMRRTLISTQGNFSSRSMNEERPANIDGKTVKTRSFPKAHLRTCSGFGVLFDPKTVSRTTRSPVHLTSCKTSQSSRLGQSVPSYVRKSFDSRVIPEKASNTLTLNDVVRFIEYSNRPMFK